MPGRVCARRDATGFEEGFRDWVQEEFAYDRHQGDLARFTSLPQAPMEVLVDAFLSNHGQGRDVQGGAHGGPTTPDGPLAAFVATIPRPRREPHPRSQGLAVPLTQFGQKGH